MKDLDILDIDRETGKLRYRFVRPIKPTKGIKKLLQEVAKVILTTPGTDFFAPESGGGAYKLFGAPSPDSTEEFRADMIIIVKNAQESIVNSQEGESLPASETLIDLRLIDAVYYPSQAKGEAVVLVTNLEGKHDTIAIP